MCTNRSLYLTLCQFALRVRLRLFAKPVGADPYGNLYYELKSKDGAGRFRRFVLYRGEPEASCVPAAWFGWLHHSCDAPLPSTIASGYLWDRPHAPNLTGTQAAYQPVGSQLSRLGRLLTATPAADPSVWRPSESNEG